MSDHQSASDHTYYHCLQVVPSHHLAVCNAILRCGPLIDLCWGPHVRHTGKIKAAMVTKVPLSVSTHNPLHLNIFRRTHLLTGRETVRQNHFNVSTASPSQRPNNLKSGSNFKKRLRRETTVSWGKSKTSSSTSWVLAAASSCFVEHTFTTLWWNSSEESTTREVIKRWSHRTSTTRNRCD